MSKFSTAQHAGGEAVFHSIELTGEIRNLLETARSVRFAKSIEELEAIACGGDGEGQTVVAYELPDGKVVNEVEVVRVRNGISANYFDPYMRRRDPECMLVADDRPSDKARFKDRLGYEFTEVRQSTLQWLQNQELAVFAFEMGQPGLGADALAICPANAGFFAFGLGLLQGVVNPEEMGRMFKPATIIYVAPPFRHTHFNGKQVVVHNRNTQHEIFSYNLYPGPSAKKGVYGALIELGEREGWVTAHCSAVQVTTPYDNILNLMHEGASGGGKSETLQQPHRQPDGRLLFGTNTLTNEQRFLELPRTCELRPVCDDMALCHPDIQLHEGELTITDAEEGWFIRVDHIKKYGTDPDLEYRTIHPEHSQLFLNVDAFRGGTALIWEHIKDAPGKPCPNPRVIVPRRNVPNAIRNPVPIDVRSFGVRTPPCTQDNPSYGIIGMMHVLPPALAWLWRLVAPRGHANPSIVETQGMTSEGVGSYWPFATGTKVAQANLLLRQLQAAPNTLYVLIPNQHIGAWETGFMPQWVVRDYLARRGHARFREDQISPSRCPLLGYALNSMRIEGEKIPRGFLQVDTQPEVKTEGFDAGAAELKQFFREQLNKFVSPDLDPLGQKIIRAMLDDASISDLEALMTT